MGLLWELAAHIFMSPIFPPLSRIFNALVELLLSGKAQGHIGASLQHILIGFGMATIIGGVFGIAMSQSRVVYTLVMPVVDSIRPIAALTIFPLLILLLGLGLWSKAFVIFWTAWPPILLSTLQSIRQVDTALLEAARIDGATRWRILTRVILPLASPSIVTGLRIGMGGGWISLVSAEMLGSSEGLGYLVLSSSQTFQFASMYAAIMLIAVIGLAMNSVLSGLQHLLEVKVCTRVF